MLGRKWLKWQWLLVIVVGLCALAITLPAQSASVADISPSVSISPGSGNYALVPIPTRAHDGPRKGKYDDTDTYVRMASIEANLPSSWTERYLTTNSRAISDYLSSFATVFTREFSQTCHVLDIPPPSYI